MKLRIRYIAVAFFLTASWVAAEMVRFAVVGDTQGLVATTAINEPIFSHIVQELATANPPVEFVTIVGDLTNGSKDDTIHAADYRQWRQIADPWYKSNFTALKVYPLPGNHDDHGSDNYLQLWQAAFPELPDNGPDNDKKMTYSFDIGPCHFAMVNTSAPARDHQVNLDWLENDLKNSSKPTKFVLGHEPAYKVNATRISSLDVYPELRDRFWQILAANKVKAYFCGHDHVYDHWIKDNVHQIITGGGGGSSFEFHQYLVVEADETDATVSMYREDNNQLIEQYKLSDTANVPNNDRTIYDDPTWPAALLSPCSWGSIPLILLFLIPFGRSLTWEK
jgi:3',5'-cyclic-AMP phosphodiesterase